MARMRSALCFLGACGVLALGCDPAPPPFAESCQNIIDACHDLDLGTGEAHECHETAHDVATAEACDPIEVDCVAACEVIANTDAGPHHDGGHEH
jgi:hypothetical protein